MEMIKYNAPSAPLLCVESQVRLVNMFKDNGDFIRHLTNLKRTREGLNKIHELRPDLNEAIKPQFDTLNELIGILLSNHNALIAYHEIK